MIESMNKLYLVIHNKNIDKALKQLQDLGVLHINKKDFDQAVFANQLKLQAHIDEFLHHYKTYDLTNIKQVAYDSELVVLLQTYKNNIDEYHAHILEKTKLEKTIKTLEPWGDFDSQMIAQLAEEGITLNYYEVSHKQFEKLDLTDFDHAVISQEGGTTHFVTIHRNGKEKELPLEKLYMPAKGLKECQKELDQLEKIMTEVQSKIDSLAIFYQHVLNHANKLKEQMSFCKALHSLDDHYESFSSLIGWVPSKKLDLLTQMLKKMDDIAYLIEEEIPEEELEKVPVLLRNGKFATLFEPITKLFALPQYSEFDLTPFFAPFFVMFFGLCLADAGYGLVIFLATLVGFFQMPKGRSIMALGMILGVSTAICGLLTGTTFGINLFETQLPILSDIATFPPDHTFYLALLIGLFQILFGMGVQLFQRYFQQGFWAALSPLGWMILLFFLVIVYLGAQPAGGDFKIGLMIIQFCKSVPTTLAYWGLAIGASLILLFNDMKVNIFLRFGKGLWELYGITGVFGDLLSYIRLFALGISSAILGTVINSIGQQLLAIDIPVLGHMLFFIFVVVGHTGNLLLAALGSFVHPLRLTFVEFYKNAGFAGGGEAYSPLRRYYLEGLTKKKES